MEKLPIPSIDRPFGIHLWPIFSKAFEKVVGYPAEEFRFVHGVTPLSTLKETCAWIFAYYVIILGGREVMRAFAPVQLRTVFQIHNLMLTLISGALLALFLEQLIPTLYNHGLFYGICNIDGGWTQPLVVLYYVSFPRLNRVFFPGSVILTRVSAVELPHQIREQTFFPSWSRIPL